MLSGAKKKQQQPSESNKTCTEDPLVLLRKRKTADPFLTSYPPRGRRSPTALLPLSSKSSLKIHIEPRETMTLIVTEATVLSQQPEYLFDC